MTGVAGERSTSERNPPATKGREEMDHLDEELRDMLKDVGEAASASLRGLDAYGPQHYYRDGTPIVGDDTTPAYLKWAKLFEDMKYKIVGQTRTLYGEKLSTVWLGLDHSFMPHINHRPIIFETMLFAPSDHEEMMRGLRSVRDPEAETAEQRETRERHRKETEKKYPHDNLQIRYATEREAEDMHQELKLQCLIPPRWRAFLLGTIGGVDHWKLDNEDEGDDQ
jgi:hypothetical protein